MIILLLYVLADFRLEYQKKQTVDLHLYMKDQRSAFIIRIFKKEMGI